MKKLHNKDFSIAVKKGTDANKSKFAKMAVQGEMYFATDSGSLYVANTTAGAFDALLTKYDFTHPFQLTSDTEANILAATPVNPSGESTIMYSTDTDNMYIYNGGNWYTFNNGFSVPNTYSMSFDGSNDYLDLTSAPSSDFNFGTGDFGLSMWVKADSISSLYHTVLGSYDGTPNNWQVFIGSAGLNVWNGTLYGGGTINAGVWYNCVVARSSGVLKTYINGQQTSSQTVTSSYTPSTSVGTRIGAPTGGQWPHWDGLIDEVAIFNSALSASQITNIYNGGTPANISSLNPVGWWRMGDNDGGAGTTITDQGSGGNDATLLNGPTFSTDTPS